MRSVLAHFTLEALNGAPHLTSLYANLGVGEQMVDEDI